MNVPASSVIPEKFLVSSGNHTVLSLEVGGPVNQYHRKWRRDEVSVAFDAGGTDHPVVTLVIRTPVGELRAMGTVEVQGRVMTVRGLHVQGGGPNTVGWANLRVVAEAAMEEVGLDGLVILGAGRTTGAGRGRVPGVLRFAAHPAAAP